MTASETTALVDSDALLVALVIAPATYSRNKFFELFETLHLRTARRRALLVRSIVKDLTEPWPHPGEIPPHPGPVVVEEYESEGRYFLTYSVAELGYRRSVVLDRVEAAAMRYALSRVRKGEVSSEDRRIVEACLARLHDNPAKPASQDVDDP